MLTAKGRRPPEPPKWIEAWRELPGPHPWAGAAVLPRHAPQAPSLVLDRTVEPRAELLELQVELRPYQQQVLQAWARAGHEGVAILPCGAGKTTIGMQAIASSPTPALVLVHTLDLARQWVERARAQLGVDVEIVGGGKKVAAPGRVTVATFQTLASWSWWTRAAWAAAVGLLIVDEAHHVPAETFGEVVMSIPARRRLGLTATDKRADGLTELLWWHLGPEVARVDQQDLVDAGVVMGAEIRQVATGWTPPVQTRRDGSVVRDRHGQPETVEWVEMLTAMAASGRRNAIVLAEVEKLLEDRRQVLLLTERVGHAELLADELVSRGIAAAALHGQRKKRERADVLAAADGRELQVVCATTVADEGLDLPRLDALLLAMPVKPGARLQQRVGRVTRTAEGKRRPVVVDLVDDHPKARDLAAARGRFFKKAGISS